MQTWQIIINNNFFLITLFERFLIQGFSGCIPGKTLELSIPGATHQYHMAPFSDSST